MKRDSRNRIAQFCGGSTTINIRICLRCLSPVIFLACSFASVCAQEQKREVRIVDSTRDPQSPIEVGGKLFVTEEIRNQELLVAFEGNVTAKNISQKRILALVTELDLSSSYAGVLHGDFRDDRFFSPDLLEPDQSEELAHEDETAKFSEDYRRSPPATPPRDPMAKVQVLYVQFEDGSTFRALGGPNTLYQNRAASLWALKQLERALRCSGKEGFEASLREAPSYNEPLAVLQSISKVAQTGGVDEAVDRMQTMLRLAASRHSLM
jgi:hypothetical protein